eukprot:1014685-Pyramimonas_sp.AAC.1
MYDRLGEPLEHTGKVANPPRLLYLYVHCVLDSQKRACPPVVVQLTTRSRGIKPLLSHSTTGEFGSPEMFAIFTEFVRCVCASAQDMWLHAAGYDMAGPTRSVPMGPVAIRPIPHNARIAFND